MAGDDHLNWVKAFALRASAVSLGFVFTSAAWRRFVNAPAKLEIESSKNLANKLVHAAPGSPLEGVIHWLLQRPQLTEAATYIMTVGELLAGLGLIFGFITRGAAAGAALLNVALMLIFGWQGFECLDEWTMAALGFAISVSVMLYGPGVWSLDNAVGIDPFARLFTRPVAITLAVFSIVFTAGFYQYYFGIDQLHRRTSVGAYSIVAQPGPRPDVATLYVKAGPSSAGAYVRSIVFSLKNGETIEHKSEEINVLKSYFEPWADSAKRMDEVLVLRLGSKTDIAIPKGAIAATIDLIGEEDQQVTFE